MPFERYLKPAESASSSSSNLENTLRDVPRRIDAQHQDVGVEFHIPPFMYSQAPTLAPGGGAEVLPLDGPATTAWFENYGFAVSHLPAQLTKPRNNDERAAQQVQDQLAPAAASLVAMNLPLYSATGFDLLGVLARIVSRPHPTISLGPVDLTCSFCVVDTRQRDSPLIYASPSFTRLTLYEESEIVGRNCRFLQSPTGDVRKGQNRRPYSSPEAVAHMSKALSADKEVQTTIVNYRKDGTAFINLVTVIPVPPADGEDEVCYHVGFQVDLTMQPEAILRRLQDGTYMVNYSNQVSSKSISAAALPPPQQKKAASQSGTAAPLPSIQISKDLKKMLADFHVGSLEEEKENQKLSLVLLQHTPDFLHVVSLKGEFLYVAPTVSRVLGYSPEDLAGKGLADICHPADVVPLKRELKEASAYNPQQPVSSAFSASQAGSFTATPCHDFAGPSTTAAVPYPQVGMNHELGNTSGAQYNGIRAVDLLFRARTKAGMYVWVECRGRLHIEPGKGRKAIVLSGRAKGMFAPLDISDPSESDITFDGDEFYATLTSAVISGWSSFQTRPCPLNVSMMFTSVSSRISSLLGWSQEEITGRTLAWLLRPGCIMQVARVSSGKGKSIVNVPMRHKSGAMINVCVTVFDGGGAGKNGDVAGLEPAGLVIRVRSAPTSAVSAPIGGVSSAVDSSPAFLPEDVFNELNPKGKRSWQYELQQVRFKNARLSNEVRALEGALGVIPAIGVPPAYGSIPGQAASPQPPQSASAPVSLPSTVVTSTPVYQYPVSTTPSMPGQYSSIAPAVEGYRQEEYALHQQQYNSSMTMHAPVAYNGPSAKAHIQVPYLGPGVSLISPVETSTAVYQSPPSGASYSTPSSTHGSSSSPSSAYQSPLSYQSPEHYQQQGFYPQGCSLEQSGYACSWDGASGPCSNIVTDPGRNAPVLYSDRDYQVVGIKRSADWMLTS